MIDSNHKMIVNGEVKRELRKSQPVTVDGQPTGGFASVHFADEFVEVQVYCDMKALLEMMGARAATTKTGVSKLQDGLIIAKVVRRRQVPT